MGSTFKTKALAASLAIFVFLLVFGVSRFLYQELQALEAEHLLSNVTIFVFMNLNVVILMVLGFLVAKNVFKLILDRRRKILGAKLRTRLVLAFVSLALIPTVVLFGIARGIVGSMLQEWFSPKVESSKDAALAVAKFHYDSIEEDLYRETYLLSQKVLNEILAQPGVRSGSLPKADLTNFEFLRPFLLEKLREYGITEIVLVSNSAQLLLQVRPDLSVLSSDLPNLNQEALSKALSGSIVIVPEQSSSREFLRGYAPLLPLKDASPRRRRSEGSLSKLDTTEAASYALVTSVAISGDLRKMMSNVVDSYDEYKEFRSQRRLVSQGYLLVLIVATFFIVVAAIWVGFYLARTLTVPIQHLAAGTQEVARGNLDFKIPETGDDELSILVSSFNKMTADLKETTGELVQRRRYMETVLESVGVGVIAIDSQSRVMTCNAAAAEILGDFSPETAISLPIKNVLPASLLESLSELFSEFSSPSERSTMTTYSHVVAGVTHQIQVIATRLVGDNGEALGTVLLLDDLTELVSTQRMVAWREVARRIAHEIKNPLTPIQLSAQRIRRRFAPGNEEGRPAVELPESDRSVLIEGTDTIIKQVEALRILVNEFSRFAQLPKSNPAPMDLNLLIGETVRFFEEAHPDITFSTELEKIPTATLDREQMGRVFLNLLDNAVASVHTRWNSSDGVESVEPNRQKSGGMITVSTSLHRNLGVLTVGVADNGVGISDGDKPRLFEPYFSRRKGGTGLGLSIVNSIVADHNGFIRVRDNSPFGAIFIIELPVPTLSSEVA